MFFELVGVMNKSPYVEKLFDHIMSLEDNPGKQMFKIINWIYVKSMMNHRHVEVMYYSNLKCAEMQEEYKIEVEKSSACLKGTLHE